MFGKKERKELQKTVDRLVKENADLRARIESAPVPASVAATEPVKVESGGKGSGKAQTPASLSPACGPEDHAVYTSSRKFHASGSWLRRNWPWVTGFALRITSLATGKEIFSRAADVLPGEE